MCHGHAHFSGLAGGFIFFDFHPYLPGEMIPNLIYAYFSKWGGSKTINEL